MQLEIQKKTNLMSAILFFFFPFVSFDCFFQDEQNSLQHCINAQFILYIRVGKRVELQMSPTLRYNDLW